MQIVSICMKCQILFSVGKTYLNMSSAEILPKVPSVKLILLDAYELKQDKIFRRNRLSTGANFVHVYLEIWNKGILKFNKFST